MNASPLLKLINDIWSTLRQPETGDTLLGTVTTLWKLFTRFVLLLLLLALLVIATAVWLWGSAFQKGREYRAWLNQDPLPSDQDFLARIAQDLQTLFQGFADFAKAIMMKILGVQPATTATPATTKVLASGGTPITTLLRAITSTEKV